MWKISARTELLSSHSELKFTHVTIPYVRFTMRCYEMTEVELNLRVQFERKL